MAGADTATASEIMKEYFLEGVREELNNSSMLYNQIEKNTDEVEGDRVVAAHHIGRNAGIGSRLEGETLPTPGSQTYARSEYTLKGNYGTGRVSTRLMKSIKTNRGAFIDAARAEMTKIKDDLKREVNFQYYGDGTGVIAALTNTASGNDIVLTAATDRRVWNYLHLGMKIDIGTVASPGATATNRQITAINPATRTITFDGAAVDAATTDRLFRAGSGGSGVDQRVVTGLAAIIDDDTEYAGIDPADVPEWASYVDNVGGALTEDVLVEATDEIGIKGASNPNLVVTTHAIRRKLANDLQADRQFVNPTTLKGGFKGVTIQTPSGDLDLTADRDCQDGVVYLLNTSELVEWMYDDWDFLDEDNSVLHLIDGVAAYGFVLEKFHELGTTNRKSQGKLTGVTV